MNWKKILAIFTIGIFCSAGIVSTVSAAKNTNDYDYKYTINGQEFTQKGGFGFFNPNQAVKDSDIVGYGVDVYDSQGNWVGKGNIIVHSKNSKNSAQINWICKASDVNTTETNTTGANTPEEAPVINNTNRSEDNPTDNDWNYSDIEINSTQDESEIANETEVANETQENEPVTNEEEPENIIEEITEIIVEIVEDITNNDVETQTNVNNNTNNITNVNNNDTNVIDNTKTTSNNNASKVANDNNTNCTGSIDEDDEDKGIDMIKAGNEVSIISIALIIIICMVAIRIYQGRRGE